MSTRALLLAFLLLAAGALAGCAEEPPPEPQALVDQAADALLFAEGFAFRVDREGDLRDIGGWLIRSASGEYEAPSDVYADVKVALGGLIVQAAVASIEDRSWQQDPLSGEWSEIDPEDAITVAGLFGADGLPAVLTLDFTNPEYVGRGEVDGLPGESLHQVAVDLDAARLSDISAGLIPPTVGRADLWVSDEGEFRRVAVTDETGRWVIDVFDYGPDHVVEPPV
jgi:hypothetical protein